MIKSGASLGIGCELAQDMPILISCRLGAKLGTRAQQARGGEVEAAQQSLIKLLPV